jgi:two-component system, chemotaxis family, chemotaxis protein CheY
MRVGLLEDDQAIQEMLVLFLQDEDYSVTAYPSAETCLAALDIAGQDAHELPVDLMIIDWRLTGLISGIEVIRRLRDNPLLASLPIILTTAAPYDNIQQLRQLRITLLAKPFAVDEMSALIKQMTATIIPNETI